MIITIIFDECCRNLVAVIPAKCARDSDATTDPGFEVRGGANGKWIVKIEYGGGGGVYSKYTIHTVYFYIYFNSNMVQIRVLLSALEMKLVIILQIRNYWPGL